ncbi:MAG: hypothetical protein WA051_02240 [Minisyncoccia bacterium]
MKNLIILIIVICLAGGVYYFYPKNVTYKNTEYGFSVSLPQSWNGYSVVDGTKEIRDVQRGGVVASAPTIGIRNPLWTKEIPRQDIPIDIYTLSQWKWIIAGQYSVSAAPIPPSELARNSKYVFALPARYNFAYPVGFEEVEKIIAGKPVKAFEPIAAPSPLNATYKIKDIPVTLVNGKAEKEIAPNSASKQVVSVFGEPVYGDLDKDGDKDAVMYITENDGGSGTFFYVVVALLENGKYLGTNAMYLGDRIAPQNINIKDGVAVANFADRMASESFAIRPSIGKSVYVYIDKSKMEIGEAVQNFEGESR